MKPHNLKYKICEPKEKMLSKPIMMSNSSCILEEITLLAPAFNISDLPKSLN